MWRLTETQLSRICYISNSNSMLVVSLSFFSFLWRYPDMAKVIGAITTHTSLSPIQSGFALGFVNYKKGALDFQPQVIQLPVQGQWFSSASSTTKTIRHDIAGILLKVALNTINQSINQK